MSFSVPLVLALLVAIVSTQTIFPQPSFELTGETVNQVSPDLQIVDSSGVGEPLTGAIKRYNALIFYLGQFRSSGSADNVITTLEITVQNTNAPLNLNTDESYTLIVLAKTATIEAATVYGAMRALESFSQLVYYNSSVSMYTIHDSVIKDEPRFNHRGVMIDTSRHFLPLITIMQMVDAMAYSKFNVLHWHIVDSQAFPYESKVYPLLSQKGAWSPRHVYSIQDVKSVIDYAAARGIRVIPEFDSPGHTLIWGNGYPNLLTPCYANGKPTGARYAVNPISNYSYEFMGNLWKEISEVFPDNYVHVGGDEVSFGCWQSNPEIQAFMAVKGWTDYARLEQYYENTLLELVGKLDKDYIVWEDVFDNGVKLLPATVVHVWKGTWQDTVAKSTAAGYRTILSQPWYLNYISYGSDWKTYYKVDPEDFQGSDKQKELMFGGECCFWGEYIDDTNIVSRAWVRASAIAERLWSPKTTTDINDAEARLHTFRCRLLQRDINAEEPNGPGFCEHEFKPTYNPPWEK